MKKEIEKHGASLIEHARSLLSATSGIADDRVADARRRMETAIDGGKEIYQGLRDRTTVGVRAADEYLHENPYKSIAVGVAVGALVMLLCTRKKTPRINSGE